MISIDEVIESHGPDDPARYVAIADYFLTRDDPEAAASALDRAYGLAPETPGLAAHRAGVLDQLAITDEHGLVWRYVPAGTFVMGSTAGDPDERPVHPVTLPAYRILDVPITWHRFCAIMKWDAPPRGWPTVELERNTGFDLHQRNKVRLQYCESKTRRARDWHAHAGMEMMGDVSRTDESPIAYDEKPMIAVTPHECIDLAAALSTNDVRTTLPDEARWEKAARGGLVGKRYSWGDDEPTRELADFDRMGDYRLLDPRALPPNGYGLYGMCGGVSEWTSDRYDALAYMLRSNQVRPDRGDAPPPEPDAPVSYVLRGGSWTDAAQAITVSFRTSRAVGARTGFGVSPTIGFRLVRQG